MQRLLKDYYRRYVYRLSQALLPCPTMQDRDKCNALLGDLPERIRIQLNSHLPTVSLIIQNLVKTCANYEEGETELFRLLDQYEPGSLTFQAAQKEWQTIKQEIAEQDRLINWVQDSRVPLPDLQQLFMTVAPRDYAAHPDSAATLVVNLWEVPDGHWPLLTFMQRLQKLPELPENIRHDLHDWCAEAPHSSLLKLPGDGAERFDPGEKTLIIVKIEPGKQDLSFYSVSFWVNDNQGNLELVDSWRVAANQLEAEISKKIEDKTIGAPLDTVTLEFYLSKVLLSLPVDTWRKVSGIQKKRFIERFKVTKGLLERQEARNFLVELRASTPDKQEKLRKMLRKHPFLYDLTDCFADWEARWKRLHSSGKLQYIDVAQPISQDGPLSLKEGICFTPLTFTPSNLELKDKNDPLVKLIIAGVPLIAWVRSGDNSAEFAVHSVNQLFEAHCACTIHTADDVVNLMHKVCRQTPDAADPYQIGHNLNLIVDNPEGKLPHIGRVMT